MPRCAVPGCRSGYSSATSNEVPFVQRHFFKPPKDPNVLREWNNAAGRANFEVTQRSYICDRHFDEADICTSFQHVVNGETVSIPRGRWELKKGAVPRHFANCAELDLKLCVENVGTNAASVLVAEDDITPVLQSESETCTEMLEHENRAASNAESMEVIMKESSTGEHWFGGIEDLPVYGAWCVQHTDERVVFYKLQEIGGVVFIERAVVINKNSTVVVSAKGKLVPESSYTFINSDKLNFTTLKDAAPFLHLIESLGICNGFDSRLCPLISTSKTAERSGRTWRSKRCAVLSAKALCVQCRKAKKNLQCRQKRRSRKSKYVPLPSALLRNLRKKTIRATVLREKYKRDLLSLKKKLSSDPSNALLSEVLAELPPLQQLAFRTALQSMKAKSSRGVRYDCGWLLSCLLLKISSPRVYSLMSRMKILPLPTSTRLRQIIRGMPCEFGFNKLSLSSIGAFMKTMKGVQCYGTLVIDEMKVRQAVAFNRQTYKIDGFVNYGDGEVSAATADHALVAMFVPLFHSWVQPIASFATKNAAPGHVLAKIVLDAIVQLRKHNAIVVAVISDGASTNKAMWSNFGISGKLHTANHKVQHPCEPNQSLYFLCDVPHIVKCIRNHLLRHKYGMIGEHRINYDHYRVLQEVDGKEQLRIVPKLTAEHVCPDNMRKMSVKLAVQLLSRSTAIGLDVYRRLKQDGLEDCEGTAAFTRIINDLFDALNIKLPRFGIRSTSKEIKIIQDFMIILDLTERNHVEKGTAMFASQVTMESLRVTLSSILELTNDLLAKGARYVLTGKLNQDPLERFFGITRSFGGDEDHPTILSFSHIYRLLSLYTPVKASIAGNVQEEPTLILATVQETMKQGKKQQLATYEKLRETISAKISEVCLPGISSASHSGPTPLPDHGYALPAVQECVVYYLCGYIVHSFLKHVNCAACISSIQSTNTKFPASLLTLAREFRNGSLKHPSTELYTMLKRVEEKLSLVLGENHLCADMFWDALDVIKDCDVPSVGCSVHKDILTSEIVHSYVVLRMHFFTRDVCKKLSASGRVSSTKKKAKLL